MVVVADEGVPELAAWQFPQERANALPAQIENGVVALSTVSVSVENEPANALPTQIENSGVALSAVSVSVENEPEGNLLPRTSYDEVIQGQQVVGQHRNPATTASELTTDKSLTEQHADVADSSDDEPNSNKVSGIHTIGYKNQL